jgi:hypothetical protein
MITICDSRGNTCEADTVDNAVACARTLRDDFLGRNGGILNPLYEPPFTVIISFPAGELYQEPNAMNTNFGCY